MSTGLHVTMQSHRYATIRDVPEWDGLLEPIGQYMSVWWMRDSEEIFADVVRPTYITVESSGQTVGAAACWPIPHKRILRPALEPTRLFARWRADGAQLTRELKLPLAEADLYPMLLVGSPRGYEQQLLVRSGLDPATRQAVLARVLDAAIEIANEHGAKLVVFPFLRSDDVRFSLALDRRDLLATYAITDCQLSSVSSQADYLASFTSHRRGAIRKEMRRFHDEGYRVEAGRLGPRIDTACDLIVAATAEKYGASQDADRLRQDLRFIADRHDEHTRLFCAIRDDEVAALSYFTSHRGAYYAHSVGFIPERSKRGALYFNILFYAPIEHAFAEGIRAVHYGGASLEAKYTRGCKLIPRWNIVVPLTSWSDDVRSHARAAGRSLFDAELATLGRAAPADELAREPGVADASALFTRLG